MWVWLAWAMAHQGASDGRPTSPFAWGGGGGREFSEGQVTVRAQTLPHIVTPDSPYLEQSLLTGA